MPIAMFRLAGCMAGAMALFGTALAGSATATETEGPARPLGTLWYPGPYDADSPGPAAVPIPGSVLSRPPPIPESVLRPAPVTEAPPRPAPTGNQATDRPLGILWYPRPQRLPTPLAPVVPAEGPVGGPASVIAPSVVPAPQAAPVAPLAGSQPEAPVETIPSAELPVRLNADEMSFDRERGIVTASGNVEVSQSGRTLYADNITYDQNTDVVTASGNVTIIEPEGEAVFGDFMQVSGDLKDAVVRNIGLILTDRSRIAGTGARRSDATVTELRNAVYSPCNLCPDDPEAPPLWQIKAVRVIHDKSTQTIEYRDAWLEMFGVPVAYTPYFQHPDPTVKRQSGFLFPSFGNSSDFGLTFEFPYFWNISPYEDLTVTPYLYTSKIPMIAAEHRRRFTNGELKTTASLTDNSSDSGDFSTEKGTFGIRGHIDSEGRFDIDDTWRWGFDLKRASDDTYLRRYGFASPQSLNSRLFAEGFRKRNYFSANTYLFQGLGSTDDQDSIPIVLPLIDFNHIGNRDRLGGRTSLDANLLALTRVDGTDTRRLSIHPKWERPFLDPLGGISGITLQLDGDFYHVNGLARSGQTDFSGFSYRLRPLAAFDWKMPFVQTRGNVTQLLEPIVSAVWSPNGGNPVDIPNEDSTELEFDDTNLFSTNRFTGYDRVEGGVRVNYGLKWGVYGASGGSSSFFIGQTYRPRTDGTFAIGSGLEDEFSDIVSRVEVSPGPYFDVSYRTRFSSDNLSPNRHEIQMSAGVPALRLNSNYVFLDQQQGSEFSGREEITASLTSQINRYWSAGLNARRDIAADEMRTAGMYLRYENECVVFTTSLTRTFYEDRDLEPTDAITFFLTLKTIGEVTTGFVRGQ